MSSSSSGSATAPPVSQRLSLVLPAYNEELNLRSVVTDALQTLPSYFADFEIVVVNDGSRDQTAAIARELSAEHPQVKLVDLVQNQGYGGALRSGFAATTGDLVMFMDADRQFAIEDIARLVPFIDTHEIVAGFRMERSDHLHRRVFAETFNVSIRMLFGVHMRDIDCAFKIFDGDMLRSIQLTSNGALINTEIMAKARRQGVRVQQVGVRHFPRTAGASTGGNPKVIFKAMRDTPRLWWHMRSYNPPPGRPNRVSRHRLPKTGMAVIAGAGATIVAFATRRKSDSHTD
ncbi:MAG: glycosyltransferase family 2 protein [Thermomicrobiales bacterium]|nr:glycosyltransferase family 2 protein [Thermomicrobiales bacterium]